MSAPVSVDVEADLRRYGRMCRAAIAEYLPSDAPAAYLARPVADYLERPGKAIRPALCLATCEAFGGSTDDALPTAVAVELLHTAFLVHDDLADESRMRRGGPTLNARYGAALAVNAGDALGLYALGALRANVRRLGGVLADRIADEFEFMAHHTVAGQALDIGWRTDNRLDLTPQDYLDLIMRKTCWYTTILPLRTGAIIGSHGRTDVEPMIRFGFALGAAFQIQDDILNLTAGHGEYGKEPLGDLLEGKRTLMLIHLLAVAGTSERERVERFLAAHRSERDHGEAEWVAERMDHHGSVGFAAEFAAGIATEADAAFEPAFEDALAVAGASPATEFVRAMISFMIERTW